MIAFHHSNRYCGGSLSDEMNETTAEYHNLSEQELFCIDYSIAYPNLNQLFINNYLKIQHQNTPKQSN